MKILSKSVTDTLKIGVRIARKIKKGDIICLVGQLGSGKTLLTKGIAKGLGIEIGCVVSPTFVLIREYKGRLPLNHFDLYRLSMPQDILALGYEEYLYGEGVSVIEWADKLKYLMPGECLKIKLSIKRDTQRMLEFSAYGDYYKELLERIYEDIRN